MNPLIGSPEMPIVAGFCAARRTRLIKHALLEELDFSQVLVMATLFLTQS